MKQLFLPFILLFCFLELNAQQVFLYRDFIATQVDESVQLDFTLLAGSTCNGITILRGTDSNAFVEVGHIPGTCGSTSSPVSYAYLDPNPPANTTLFYKLNFGIGSWSDFASVKFITIAFNSLQVRPNPVVNSGQIHFENKKNATRKIEIRNAYGILLFTETVSADFVDIDVAKWVSAMYFVAVFDENNKLIAKGKMMVS